MAKKKKIYLIYGAEVINKTVYPFCRVFTSEKKADNYYDRKYANLLEKFNDESIQLYTIDYKEKKIKIK